MRKQCLLMTVLVCIGSVASGAQVYQDQASFLAAVQPGYYHETFDTLDNVQLSGTETFGPQNGFSFTVSTPDVLWLWDSGFSWLSSDLVGTDYPNQPITFDLSASPATAFGGNFFVTDVDFGQVVWGAMKIELNDGTVVDLVEPYEQTFVGFTSDQPITSVTLTPSGGGFLGQDPYASFDNVYVGAAVPEPASCLLLGLLGVLGLGLRRR